MRIGYALSVVFFVISCSNTLAFSSGQYDQVVVCSDQADIEELFYAAVRGNGINFDVAIDRLYRTVSTGRSSCRYQDVLLVSEEHKKEITYERWRFTYNEGSVFGGRTKVYFVLGSVLTALYKKRIVELQAF